MRVFMTCSSFDDDEKGANAAQRISPAGRPHQGIVGGKQKPLLRGLLVEDIGAPLPVFEITRKVCIRDVGFKTLENAAHPVVLPERPTSRGRFSACATFCIPAGMCWSLAHHMALGACQVEKWNNQDR
jgi:hypothetical protein